MPTKRVIAIDPGKMTGMSCWTWEKGSDPVLVWSAEVDEEQYADAIRYEFARFPDIEFVCERFIINADTAKKSQAPFSLELIGILKQIVRDGKRDIEDIHMQNPVDAKKMFPNPALKTLGYWHKGGAGHALDSMRHGLLYLAKSGWPPAKLLG